jgi:hypothetical protein
VPIPDLIERPGRGFSTTPRKNTRHFVPTAHPAYAPAINAIADYGWLAKAEKLALNFHSHLCMALLFRTVKVGNGD